MTEPPDRPSDHDLIDKLREIASDFPSGDPEDRRASAGIMLFALLEHAWLTDGDPTDPDGGLAPIRELLIALLDAERGVRHPLLEAVSRKGRPLHDFRKDVLKIFASVAMEFLMQDGATKSEAAITVSSKLEPLDIPTIGKRGPSTGATTVTNWRNGLMGHAEPNFASRRFADILAEISNGQVPPRAAANWALDYLEIWFRKKSEIVPN